MFVSGCESRGIERGERMRDLFFPPKAPPEEHCNFAKAITAQGFSHSSGGDFQDCWDFNLSRYINNDHWNVHEYDSIAPEVNMTFLKITIIFNMIKVRATLIEPRI